MSNKEVILTSEQLEDLGFMLGDEHNDILPDNPGTLGDEIVTKIRILLTNKTIGENADTRNRGYIEDSIGDIGSLRVLYGIQSIIDEMEIYKKFGVPCPQLSQETIHAIKNLKEALETLIGPGGEIYKTLEIAQQILEDNQKK